MKALIQRVSHASVSVSGSEVSAIGPGLLVLLGVVRGDTGAEAARLARKIAGMRIFPDSEGVMNVNITDAGGDILAVSQFTLAASLRRGNRPSYALAAPGKEALPLYEDFCLRLEELTGRPVGRGVFGADMQVSLVNDGPVTIIADTADF